MENELREDGWEIDADDGFVGHVGGIWRREVAGQLQLAFIARPFHANRSGLVHGGMLMTFADRALGMAGRIATGSTRSATVSLTHQFVAPVRIGALVWIAPQVVRTTTRMSFVTGTAMVGQSAVMTVQGVYRIATAERRAVARPSTGHPTS